MARPSISVLMPVFNGERYLAAAIESILAQTFSDYEFIIVDDGSVDATPEMLLRYADHDRRIRVLHNNVNKGLVFSLNRALEESQTSLIARMDADDIALPSRFERQYAFLRDHPEVGLLGTWADIRHEEEPCGSRHTPPTSDWELRFELLFNNPFVHSSMIFSRDVAVAAGKYRSSQKVYPEDYDLWSRMAQNTKMANIPETLQIYRETTSSICRKNNYHLIQEKVSEIAACNILFLLKDDSFENEVHSLMALLNNLELAEKRTSLFNISRLLWKISRTFGKEHELTVADRVWLWKRTLRYLARAYKHLFLPGRIGEG